MFYNLKQCGKEHPPPKKTKQNNNNIELKQHGSIKVS